MCPRWIRAVGALHRAAHRLFAGALVALHRHRPEHFQNHVLFTNYQFYVSEFEAYARAQLADPDSGYTAFVRTGNVEITDATTPLHPAEDAANADLSPETRGRVGHHAGQYRRRPIERQNRDRSHRGSAPACVADGRALCGAAQHAALGRFCAGPRLPARRPRVWMTTCRSGCRSRTGGNPDRAGNAVAEVTELEGYELKRIMRTGTVATIDNRNWELRDQSGPVQRLANRAPLRLDMESATIAANGFRFRVPYGTLLCVSDKPLHGELKLPGMASDFYKTQVARHLMIGIRAMDTCAKCRWSVFTAGNYGL